MGVASGRSLVIEWLLVSDGVVFCGRAKGLRWLNSSFLVAVYRAVLDCSWLLRRDADTEIKAGEFPGNRVALTRILEGRMV